MSQSNSPAMTREQITAKITALAWQDEGFRQRILRDANAVYEEETGRALPPGLTLKVVEDDAHTVHFVIPGKPADTSLSDEDLEAVVGGSSVGDKISAFLYTTYQIAQQETASLKRW